MPTYILDYVICAWCEKGLSNAGTPAIDHSRQVSESPPDVSVTPRVNLRFLMCDDCIPEGFHKFSNFEVLKDEGILRTMEIVRRERALGTQHFQEIKGRQTVVIKYIYTTSLCKGSKSDGSVRRMVYSRILHFIDVYI